MLRPLVRVSPAVVVGTLVIGFLTACGADAPASDETEADGVVTGPVVVFAAASLTDALDELATAFEASHPGVTVELNLAGSSSLREQILGGAPADVFVSADVAHMEALVEAEAATAPKDVAVNRLEVAVPAGNAAGVRGLADLADPDLLIGLCAEEVPCGQFAREVLSAAGVVPAPDTNEPDVRALLTKIQTGELDAGIVYRTDVLAAGDAVEGIEIPADENVLARYPAATLTEADNPGGGAAFVAFLLSDEGQEILVSHGFTRP
jgi:molybdate transport system substrate-binding protein